MRPAWHPYARALGIRDRENAPSSSGEEALGLSRALRALDVALSAAGIPCHPSGTWRDATRQRRGLTSSRPVSGK